MYRLVTRVTSDVGVPWTYLVNNVLCDIIITILRLIKFTKDTASLIMLLSDRHVDNFVVCVKFLI